MSSSTRVAERLLPRGVEPTEVAVEARDAEHVARHAEERLELLLGALALDELADLAADRGEHGRAGPRRARRISRLKNSSTPSTTPPSLIGKPNAPCSPSRAATGARGKFGSCTTSSIQAGSPLRQTRPGQPTARSKVGARLTASNSGTRRGLRAARCRGSGSRCPSASTRPDRAVLVAQRLAERAQDPRGRLGERRRLGERAGRLVLRVQAADRVGLAGCAHGRGVRRGRGRGEMLHLALGRVAYDPRALPRGLNPMNARSALLRRARARAPRPPHSPRRRSTSPSSTGSRRKRSRTAR